MMFEHWDLKSDEAYMRDAISAWYSEGSKYNADEPSNALRYSQVRSFLKLAFKFRNLGNNSVLAL